MSIRVHQFERCPRPGGFSIERLFRDIRNAMPADIACVSHLSRFPSKGVVRRLWNVVEAGMRSGPVNHVIGDVHFLTLALPRKRTILTIHDCGNLYRLKGINRWILKLFWFTLPMRNSFFVTTISEATRKDLCELVSSKTERIHVIPNCVSPEFQYSPKPELSDPPRVLIIGTKPNKNVERMAEAMAGLNLIVDVVGELNEAQREIFSRYKVRFCELGYISNAELLPTYQRCDILAFASTLEGFGMPILEAQATGRPVLTSALSSMPEVAGNAACLVDPYNIGAMRQALKRLIDDTDYRARLVADGLENVKWYRPEVIAGRYADLYRQVGSKAFR